MDLLRGDSKFNMEDHTALKRYQKFEWLAASFVKSWPTEKESKMPDRPWLSVDERVLRLREIAVLE